MCGIVGIASNKKIESRSWLERGRDSIAHRGPDGAGIWWDEDGRVGLAHRRLSIIDLSFAGHQPMHYAASKCTLVFNGEIYNHHALREQLITLGYTFNSNTDTEVILASYDRWGVDFLSHLKGMYAFALYDPKLGNLVLARDRAGEKPLFFSHEAGVIKFGSELKALLCDPTASRKLDAKSLDMYLGMGYVSGSNCILDCFHKLSPGHFAIFDMKSGDLKIQRYWNLPNPTSDKSKTLNLDALTKKLEGLLEASISRQLLADVPVGVLLSGGVDSSLVTALASRVSHNVRTFTVGFSGCGDFDESKHAHLIANHFNTEHLELDAGNIGPKMLIDLARQFDEPMVDSSMLPTYLVSRLVRDHCTVALGGDGADELFGGYMHYSKMLKSVNLRRVIPNSVGHTVSKLTNKYVPQGVRGRHFLSSLSCDFRRGLPVVASLFDSKYRQKLTQNFGIAEKHSFSEEIWNSRIPSTDCLLDRITRMDFMNYMPEDILVKIDRSSMLSSLELRAPFLDSEIIEFAFSEVPSRFKADENQRKILLKKLSEKLLPAEFDRQRKQGFSLPLMQWLKGGVWRDFFVEILLSEESIFNKECIQELFRGIDKGRHNGERLFSLVMFELWKREYKIEI
jgi:asparagine synthase (glutamine-hydrolysing)